MLCYKNNFWRVRCLSAMVSMVYGVQLSIMNHIKNICKNGEKNQFILRNKYKICKTRLVRQGVWKVFMK